MKPSRLFSHLMQIMVAVLLLAGCAVSPATPKVENTPIPPTATPVPPTPEPTAPPATATPDLPLAGKRVLFVLYAAYEEDEFGKPRAILEGKGAEIFVTSNTADTLTGHRGTKITPEAELSELHAADFDAILFIGGYGYYRNDKEAHRIAKEAVAENKILGAICTAPITLALADVVKGKKVTASEWQTQLEAAGATFTGVPVQVDGLLITANGPAASKAFGEAIAAALEE